MELRRQLRQALLVNAELRTLIEELRRRIATLERRCTELELQLQQALSVAERREPPASGQAWDAESAAGAQARATILATELAQVRRERTEISVQWNRLVSMLASPQYAGGSAAGPAIDYSAGRTELFFQIRTELEVRDRFAQWQAGGQRRPRETDRRLDPMRDLDEQALVASITVRWQLMDHAPHSFTHRRRWQIEGVLLDPTSEQFLIRQSRERVAYRQRTMAEDPAAVT